MRITKLFNVISVLLSIAAFISLALPFYSSHVTEGEAYNMVIKGYNLVEFSPLGSVVLISPILLIGLVFSKLQNNHKTIGILSLLPITAIALNHSCSAAYRWMTEQTSSHILLNMNYLFYSLFFLSACVCFFIKCNFYCENSQSSCEGMI